MFLLKETTHRMLIEHDPELGHRFVRNGRARLPDERGGHFVVTNSDGFRSDREFVPARRQDAKRVLFFGDSMTAGDFCDNDERFSERVAERFGAEAYNYGLSGSGTDQQLLVLENVAQGVERDLVVWCVLVENIERIKLRARPAVDRTTGATVEVPKPWFELDGEDLVLEGVPVPRVRPPRSEDGPPPASWLNRGLDLYREHPGFAPLRGAVRRLPRVQSEVYRLSGAQPYPDYADPSSKGWRLMAALIRRFAQSAAAPVLLAPLPSYHFYLHGAEPVYQSLFESLAADLDEVSVVDVTTPLCQLEWSTRRRLSFRTDSHFSPLGHEIVASILSEAIADRGLL